VLAPLLVLGCADAPDVPGRGLADARTTGEYTTDRPEVGRIRTDGGWCTATLIAPQVVLTAAHCGRYQTAAAPFPVVAGRTEPWVFRTGREEELEIDRFVSFGNEVGSLDLAIAHLTRAIPTSSAVPANLATRDPAPGELLTFFGYGCTNPDETSAPRRRFTYAAGTNVPCPGDDGGPSFLANGDLYSIASAHRPGLQGRDEYAYPSRIPAQIAATINSWTSPDAPASPTVPPQPPVKRPCEEDGVRVCTQWFLEAWDSEACNSGYTRRRKCNELYDCRTSDHNDTCTSLYPGGPPLSRCGTACPAP
jgi:hypothetical protein